MCTSDDMFGNGGFRDGVYVSRCVWWFARAEFFEVKVFGKNGILLNNKVRNAITAREGMELSVRLSIHLPCIWCMVLFD